MRSVYTDVSLALHITAGVLALTLGPLALLAARRRGTINAVATAYHWAVLAVCVSAAALVAAAPARLWWLLPIAAGSYALALLGFRAARRPGSRARRLHLHLQGGSYIALVTALLVVSVGSPLAWIAPTLIGAPLITWAIRREETRSRRRPAGLTYAASEYADCAPTGSS